MRGFVTPVHPGALHCRRLLTVRDTARHRSSVTMAEAPSSSSPSSQTQIRRVSVGSVPARAAARLLEVARASMDARGEFTVALSGGSMPKQLAEGLSDADGLAAASPERWTILLADERKVPLDHPDSNYALIHEHMPFLKADRIVPIEPSLQLHECAEDYARKLHQALAKSNGVFDLILLGLGPDGHTASLFPGHSLLSEHSLTVAPISDSPKPPPERVTLTLPVINAARAVAFICTGAGKADVIQDIFNNPASGLPGAMVLPTSGELDWFVDAPAASGLEL